MHQEEKPAIGAGRVHTSRKLEAEARPQTAMQSLSGDRGSPRPSVTGTHCPPSSLRTHRWKWALSELGKMMSINPV